MSDDVLAVAGLLVLVLGAYLYAPPLALAVVGAGMIALAVARSRLNAHRRR